MIKGAKINNNIELAKIKNKFKIDFASRPRVKDIKRLDALFYGGKGVGKTLTAINNPLKILAISYDKLTQPVVNQLSRIEPDIENRVLVYDVDYLDDPEISTEYSFMQYDYLKYILESDEVKAFKPEIILHDRADILNKICEGRMRYNHQLPSIGPVDYSLWKERTAYLNYIMKISANVAPLGTFSTVYYDSYNEVEFKDKDGNIIEKKEPKYFEYIDDMVLFTIEVEQVVVKEKSRTINRATIQSSKDDSLFKTGQVKDVSNYKPLITKEMISNYFGNKVPPETQEVSQVSSDFV